MINTAKLATFDFGQMIEYMQAIGISCEPIPNSDVIEVRYKNHLEYLVDHELPYIPLTYKNIFEDKFFLKQILIDLDIPVLPGDFFHQNELESAISYINGTIGWPVVIKPTSLDSGDLVFCGIQDESTFREIWQNRILSSTHGPFIVEKYWPFCPDYRFVIFPEEMPYVAKRSVPCIIGDGKHTIQQLVEHENNKRIGPHRSALCKMEFTETDDLRCLNDQGYNFNDLPDKGVSIPLKYLTNLSKGGMCEVIDTALVHSSYWTLFQKVWDLFPELPFLSLDILSYNIGLPATIDNMVVCEAHISPGLGMFLSPGKGPGVNLYPSLVKIIFPERF